MPLTPADVRNKQFSTTRLRPGYDEEEVDAFLDEVEVELDRLIQENEELRAKLAECMRGGKSAMSALNSPLTDHEPDLMAPEPMMPEPEHGPAARGQHGHGGPGAGACAADGRPGDRRRQARGGRDPGPRPARGGRDPRQGPPPGRADHQRRQGQGRKPGARRPGTPPAGHGLPGAAA